MDKTHCSLPLASRRAAAEHLASLGVSVEAAINLTTPCPDFLLDRGTMFCRCHLVETFFVAIKLAGLSRLSSIPIRTSVKLCVKDALDWPGLSKSAISMMCCTNSFRGHRSQQLEQAQPIAATAVGPARLGPPYRCCPQPIDLQCLRCADGMLPLSASFRSFPSLKDHCALERSAATVRHVRSTTNCTTCTATRLHKAFRSFLKSGRQPRSPGAPSP